MPRPECGHGKISIQSRKIFPNGMMPFEQQRMTYRFIPILCGAICSFVSFACEAPPQRLTDSQFLSAVWQNNSDLLVEKIQGLIDNNPSISGFLAHKNVLNVFDFDHTLVDTTIKLPVKLPNGSKKLIDSKCMPLQPGDKPDFSVFENENTYVSRPINASLGRLQLYSKLTDNWNVILTARSSRRSFSSAQEYLWLKNAEPDAVIALHFSPLERGLWSKMKLPRIIDSAPQGYKKPLVIAALIQILKNRGSDIKLVRYFEDTDTYLRNAMQLLPTLYPNIRFEFFDYIRTGNANTAQYKEKNVAFAEGGKLFSAINRIFENPEKYDSGDCVNPTQ